MDTNKKKDSKRRRTPKFPNVALRLKGKTKSNTMSSKNTASRTQIKSKLMEWRVKEELRNMRKRIWNEISHIDAIKITDIISQKGEVNFQTTKQQKSNI